MKNKFTPVSVGEYDTLYQCDCGYRYVEQADAGEEENTRRRNHTCNVGASACGGCGEVNPDRRCLGCRQRF
jgi:hypothetical protein